MVRLMTAKVRLFVEHPLGAGQPVPLTRDQAHYLFSVMRMSAGGRVLLFNGSDGEWLAEITEAGKKAGTATCEAQTRPQAMPPDLWLLFAPIKKARTDFIVEKAVELGVRRIVPVQTRFTNSERIRQDRLQAHALEAAEQCGALFVPEVTELHRLDRLIDDWPGDRGLLFCDEAEAGSRAATLAGTPAPAAVLVGPEGGFSDAERARLGDMAQTRVIALGPRILRADTAAVAALTAVQLAWGDWG